MFPLDRGHIPASLGPDADTVFSGTGFRRPVFQQSKPLRRAAPVNLCKSLTHHLDIDVLAVHVKFAQQPPIAVIPPGSNGDLPSLDP
jgi:hypothetical protein